MRFLPLVLTLFLAAPVAADEKKPATVTPAEAAKKVNEKCVLQMEVKSAGKGRGVFFLNSNESYREEGNFTVFINKEGAEKFKETKIEDPAAHFKGKVIRVTGTVILYSNRPEIVVEDPKQIEVVEGKKAESPPKK